MSKLEDLFYIYIKRKAQTITKFYNIPYDESQKLVKEIVHDVLNSLTGTAITKTENKEEEK